MSQVVQRPQPARALLHARRVSNRALARQLGCSPQFVSRVLLGQAKPPIPMRRLLSRLLEVDVAELFDRELLIPASQHPGDVLLTSAGEGSSASTKAHQ